MRSTDSQWRKLREKAYREEYVSASARRAIPFQIRAMLKKTGMTQQELAKRSGLTQGVISRAANPSYGKLALNTVVRVAAGFDVAFLGLFVPFSKLVKFYETLSEAEMSEVMTFEDEDALFEEHSSLDRQSTQVVQETGSTTETAADVTAGHVALMVIKPEMLKAHVRPRPTADDFVAVKVA